MGTKLAAPWLSAYYVYTKSFILFSKALSGRKQLWLFKSFLLPPHQEFDIMLICVLKFLTFMK